MQNRTTEIIIIIIAITNSQANTLIIIPKIPSTTSANPLSLRTSLTPQFI